MWAEKAWVVCTMYEGKNRGWIYEVICIDNKKERAKREPCGTPHVIDQGRSSDAIIGKFI